MSDHDKSGTAFPQFAKDPWGATVTRNSGMTLRQYYAGQAMQALIGHEGKDGMNCGKAGVPKLAAWAVEYADALLDALAAATQQEESK